MAVGEVHVFPGFLTPVLTQISFQSHLLVFSHASAEVRGENMPERNFASTGSRIHNHQVMSPTRSPLSHPRPEICGGRISIYAVKEFISRALKLVTRRKPLVAVLGHHNPGND